MSDQPTLGDGMASWLALQDAKEFAEPKPTILVVDDEETARRLRKMHPSEHVHVAATIRDGGERDESLSKVLFGFNLGF